MASLTIHVEVSRPDKREVASQLVRVVAALTLVQLALTESPKRDDAHMLRLAVRGSSQSLSERLTAWARRDRALIHSSNTCCEGLERQAWP